MAGRDDTHDEGTRFFNRRRFLSGAAAGALGATALEATSLWAPPAVDAATITGKVYDQGGAVFNVRAYGAKGNGTTDDTAAIRTTIGAAQKAGGGVVYLPQGTYLVSGNLAAGTNGINFAGAGQSATVISVADSYPNGDVITFSNLNTGSVRMLTIVAPAQRQGGAAIHLDNASRVYIQDVDMSNMYIGCLIDGAGGVLQYIDRGYWTNFAAGGIGVWINIANSNGNDQYISNLAMDNTATIAGEPLAGVRITGSQAVWMRACDIIHAQNGLLIDPAAGGLITWCFFADCAWDTCGYRGIFINPAAGATVKGLTFVDCWSSSARTFDGCYIGGPVDGVQFVGHRFFNNMGNGLIVSGPATSVFVDACGAAGNNGGNTASSGFAFTGNCSGFAVRNSRSGAYAGFGVSQQNGIIVTGGCNNYILTGNMTQGNVSGITDAGGPTKIVTNNL